MLTQKSWVSYITIFFSDELPENTRKGSANHSLRITPRRASFHVPALRYRHRKCCGCKMLSLPHH